MKSSCKQLGHTSIKVSLIVITLSDYLQCQDLCCWCIKTILYTLICVNDGVCLHLHHFIWAGHSVSNLCLHTRATHNQIPCYLGHVAQGLVSTLKSQHGAFTLCLDFQFIIIPDREVFRGYKVLSRFLWWLVMFEIIQGKLSMLFLTVIFTMSVKEANFQHLSYL